MLKVRESHISIFYSPDFFFEGWGGGGVGREQRDSHLKKDVQGCLSEILKRIPNTKILFGGRQWLEMVFTRH